MSEPSAQRRLRSYAASAFGRSGLSDEQVARLRGPIGLDLGGRQPAEIGLAILAEMTAVRYGGLTARDSATGR